MSDSPRKSPVPSPVPAAPGKPAPAPRRRWLRRLAWTLGTAGALVGLYALAGYWAIPRFGRAPIEQALTRALGAPVRIGAITLDPFRLHLTASAVQADGTDGRPWLDVATLRAQACWCSLWGDAWVVQAVDITDPRVALARRADGTLTLPLPAPDPQASSGPPPAVRIQAIRLHGGALRFADHTLHAPARAELQDLTFTALALGTAADAAPGTLEVTARLAGGGTLKVAGTLGLVPLAAALDVQAHDVDVQAWRAWFPPGPAQAVHGGTLRAGAHVAYDADGLRVRQGSARLTALALAAPGRPDPALARIGALQADGVELKLAARELTVGAVQAQNVSADLHRAPDGRIDLIELLTTDSVAPVPGAGSGPSPGSGADASPDSDPGPAARAGETDGPPPAPRNPDPARAAPDAGAARAAASPEAPDSPAGPGAPAGPDHAPAPNAPQPESERPDARVETGQAAPMPGGSGDAHPAPPDAPAPSPSATAPQAGTAHSASATSPAAPDVPADPAGRAATGHATNAPPPAGAPMHTRTAAGPGAAASAPAVHSDAAAAAPANTPADRDARLAAGATPAAGTDGGAKGSVGASAESPTPVPAPDAPDAPPSASPGPPGTPPATAPAAPPSAWRVRVGEVQVDAGPLHWTDAATAAPFTLNVESAHLTARNYDSAGLPALPVELQVALAGGGTLSAQGRFNVTPAALEATVQAVGLPLPLAQPYVADAAHLHLRAGALDADGTLHWTRADAQATRYAGSLTVRDLDLHDTRRNERLLGWQRLSARTLEATPTGATVARMSLRGSYFRYRIGADGHSNLVGLSRTAPAPAPAADSRKPAPEAAAGSPGAAGAAGAPAPAYAVDIARLSVRDGTLDFADQTLPTPFAVTIEKLAGTLNALGNAPGTTTRGKLEGRVDGYAPTTVEGRYTAGAQGPQAQFALRFRGLELATFSPYSGKFAGYRLRRGTLDVDLEYTVENRSLRGRNRFVLDQLELGERVDSPEAASLPLGLAIALLRDSRGVIDLQLPVSGDLGDPRFDYRALIGTALKRAITKVIKAPFAFLGSLTGGQKPPQSVLFPPGETALAERQTQALGLLAQALKERTGVRVVISGAAGDADDARALAQARLQALLAAEDPDDAPWDRLRDLYRQRYDSKPEDDTPPAPDGADRSRDDERAAAFAHARARLLADLAPDAAALEALAGTRAKAVHDALAAAGVDATRLETGPARVIKEAADAPAVRTTLRLR